jgi:hypothetical protein
VSYKPDKKHTFFFVVILEAPVPDWFRGIFWARFVQAKTAPAYVAGLAF